MTAKTMVDMEDTDDDDNDDDHDHDAINGDDNRQLCNKTPPGANSLSSVKYLISSSTPSSASSSQWSIVRKMPRRKFLQTGKHVFHFHFFIARQLELKNTHTQDDQ